jgi:hypothetical protein
MQRACAMAPKKRKKLNVGELDAEHAALVDLRANIPFVSQSALMAILRIAQVKDLPKIGRRADAREARDKFIGTKTPYGPIHQVVPDKFGRRFEVQHPFAMMWLLCHTSLAMTNLMKSLPPSSSSKPLSLVFYCDEVTPGNQLSYRNMRKVWAFFYSILQFGVAALSCEDSI